MKRMIPLLLVVLAGCSATTRSPLAEEVSGCNRFADLVQKREEALDVLEPVLKAINDATNFPPVDSPEIANLEWDLSMAIEAKDKDRAAKAKQQLAFLRKAQKAAKITPPSDLAELRTKLKPADINRITPQVTRLVRLAQAARAWQETLMRDPQVHRGWRLDYPTSVELQTTAPLGQVVLWRLVPRGPRL